VWKSANEVLQTELTMGKANRITRAHAKIEDAVHALKRAEQNLVEVETQKADPSLTATVCTRHEAMLTAEKEGALFGLGHLGSNVRRSGPSSETVVQGDVPTLSAKPQEEDITQQSEPVVAVGKKDNSPSCDEAKSSVASFKMRIRGNTKASESVMKASTSVVSCMTSSPSG
ncbi:unnamed protein product, partial [Pylaiella littoralis]